MSPEELTAIRKATDEATKGPWYASDYYNEIVPIMDDNGTIRRREDSAFIANARTWVPQLLEYIEGLERRRRLRRHEPVYLMGTPSQVAEAMNHYLADPMPPAPEAGEHQVR